MKRSMISTMIKSMVNPGSGDSASELFFTNLTVAAQASIAWFTDNHKVYSDGSTDLDVASFRHAGLEVFVDQNGDDSNDGLTLLTAKKTMTSALTIPSAVVFQVSAGRHYKALPMQVNMLNGMSMVCDTGLAEFINGNEDDTSNFIADSGVYKWVGVGACYSVWDESFLTTEGYWGFLPVESSLIDLQNGSGGWFFDGSDLYVKTSDNRAPDLNIRVMTLREFYYSGSSTVTHNFYQNIAFLGFMVRPSAGVVDTVDYFKNTVHAYSGTEVNANVNSTDNKTYLENPLNHSSYTDLFSLRGYAKSMELNGLSERTFYAGSNNGSTTHSTASAVRLNSVYKNVHGDVIGDISSNSSLMVACTAKNTSGAASYGDYRVDANSNGLILVNCNNTDSTSTIGKKGDGLVYQDGTELIGTIEAPAPSYVFMGFAEPPVSPELVTNGTFDTDVSGWTPSGGTITATWDAGRLRLDASAANGAIDQDIDTEIGTLYDITATITKGTADEYFQVRNSGGGGLLTLSDEGANVSTFTATTTTTKLRMRNGTIGQGFFDDISVKKSV